MQPAILHINFPPAVKETLTDLAQDLQKRRFNPYNYDDVSQIGKVMGHQLRQLLPPATLEQVRQAYAEGRPMVIHGCPVDSDLPVTYADCASHNKKTYVSEITWLALASALGLENAVTRESGVDIVEQVVPNPEHANNPAKFSSSSVPFNWHNDGAQCKSVPEAVTLYFVRGKGEAQNRFIRTDSILAALDEKTLAELKQPNFQTWRAVSRQDHTGNYPMLETDAKGTVLRLGNIKPLTPEATAAKQKIYDAIAVLEADGEYLSFHGRTGDCVILPNRTYLHNRSAFQSIDPDQPRWVQMGVLKHGNSLRAHDSDFGLQSSGQSHQR